MGTELSPPMIFPLITAVATAASSLAAVAGLGWWLSGRFRAIEITTAAKLDEHAERAAAKLDEHEEKDQERHEQNLARFGDINVTIAKMSRIK